MARFRIGMVIALSWLSPALVAAGPPLRVPNAVPYRVSVPVATGRDGTAQVFLRTLIARDGTTTVDIATAPFGTRPIDAITELLVRALAPSDAAVVIAQTYHDTIPGGAFTWTLRDLVAGQTVEADAHVDDRAMPRTDLVRLRDVVRRRPDLRVGAIDAPVQVMENVPVAITATIAEHNGDVGARTTCLLLVDGAETDRIEGLWVDAGDSVSCAFTYAFGASGSHTIRVTATDVEPADWEPSDNLFDRTIEVAAPFEQYYVSAGESTETQSASHWYSYRYNSDPVFGQDHLSSRSLNSWTQGIDVQGWVNRRWAFPVEAIDATASDDTGTRLSAHIASLAATSVSATGQWACGSTTDGTGDRYVYAYVCSGHNDNYGDYSHLYLQQHAGLVTYTSLNYDRVWSGDPDNILGYYNYYSNTITTGTGALVPYGPAVQVGLSVMSAGTTDGIYVTVPIGSTSTTRYDNPLMCGVDTFSWASLAWCSEYHDVMTSRFGVVVAGSWP